jgi:hypothetical protein
MRRLAERSFVVAGMALALAHVVAFQSGREDDAAPVNDTGMSRARASDGGPSAVSDAGAVALARRTLQAMGGAPAWENTRFLTWRFLGRRLHHWDRWTGDVRMESDRRLVLMNVHSKQGRVWEDGTEITDPDVLQQALEEGYAWWVNDSYWLIMPYKLLDPGVVLRFVGPATLPDGRAAQEITVTFEDGTGLTPRNRYDVWIADDTWLVEQWAYYASRDDEEPRFTGPWADWKRFGRILLATDKGRGEDWEIAAPDSLPRALFESP